MDKTMFPDFYFYFFGLFLFFIYIYIYLFIYFGTTLIPDISMTSNGFCEKGPTVLAMVHAENIVEVINSGCLAEDKFGAATSCCVGSL